jgi:arsenate reductase
MPEVRILHNPRCSKSRATLALLEERGIRPVVTDYLASPPSTTELERIVDLLGGDPRVLLRADEPECATLGLTDPGLSRPALLQALADHPRLIQRPVVLANGRAAIGRPPEAVLAIL